MGGADCLLCADKPARQWPAVRAVPAGERQRIPMCEYTRIGCVVSKPCPTHRPADRGIEKNEIKGMVLTISFHRMSALWKDHADLDS